MRILDFAGQCRESYTGAQPKPARGEDEQIVLHA